MPYNPNSDNRTADVLSEMRHHFRYCRECKGAMKARDYSLMCDRTKRNVITAALMIDTAIERRIKAKRNNVTVFYACPEMGAHSQTWRLTAEPLVAVGIQDGLF